MKKKIVCLALALLMVLPLLAGCSQEGTIENINEEASRYTTTLNVWLITESPLVAEASKVLLSGITPTREINNLLSEEEKAVLNGMSTEQKQAWNQVFEISEAINKQTKAKYKTQLNLRYFTEDQYYAAVEAAFTKHKENIDAGNFTVENKTEETILNEYGIPELKYPAVADYQVDIFFIGSQEKYFNYINNNWLTDMRDHLLDSAMKLNSYVNSAYLQAAAIDGMIYALPNNHGIGEYVYLLADKDLMDEYNSSLTGATLYDTEFKEYLDYIYTTYTGSDKIYPIYTDNANGKIDLDYAHYWSFDLDTVPGLVVQKNDSFSIFGDSSTDKTVLDHTNLLTDATYMKALANKTHYEKSAGYVTTDPEQKAAVRVVTGGWELKQQYEAQGYEVLVMQYPQLTDEEIYSSMFGIGKYSVSAVRSAEVLTFLNTDAYVRNILQYGLEDVNYTLQTVEIDGEEYSYVEEMKNNLYKMDVNKTGNVFLTYPDSADSVLRWEYEQQQNLDMVMYPTLALNFSSAYKLDEKSYRIVAAASAKLAEVLDAMTSAEEVEGLYLTASRYATVDYIWQMTDMILCYTGDISYTVGTETFEITKQDLGNALLALQKSKLAEEEDAVQSPYALYYEWCVRQGLVTGVL